MSNQLTVGELIEQLKRFDPDMLVRMGMNMEYESGVYADFLEAHAMQGTGEGYLLITDCPASLWEDDGQPDEAQEWYDYDPDA